MTKPIRKSLAIPLFDEEVHIDVDFRIIEHVERVFNVTAEIAAAVELAPGRVRRHTVADVICLWLQGRELPQNWKRGEIREHVILADAEQMNVYVGCIQAAVLYILRHISGEQFDALARGEDLDADDEKVAEAKKKPSPAKPRSSGRRTSSR